MLDGLKRLITKAPAGAEQAVGDWTAVAGWAGAMGYEFRNVREGDGFVVDGRVGALAWRLEWGPSQRSYVKGQELRLRAELGVPTDVQALVIDRALQDTMEKAVFDQYVEGVQTRIDNQTPPEMRWLVMFPKLSGQEIGTLRERYAAHGSSKPWVQQWLAGPLAQQLAAAVPDDDRPLVLMISRGRLTLRTALADPATSALSGWIGLFETALQEARRVAEHFTEAATPSTQPSLWTSSAGVPDGDKAS
jgi:hypothetical protein